MAFAYNHLPACQWAWEPCTGLVLWHWPTPHFQTTLAYVRHFRLFPCVSICTIGWFILPDYPSPTNQPDGAQTLCPALSAFGERAAEVSESARLSSAELGPGRTEEASSTILPSQDPNKATYRAYCPPKMDRFATKPADSRKGCVFFVHVVGEGRTCSTCMDLAWLVGWRLGVGLWPGLPKFLVCRVVHRKSMKIRLRYVLSKAMV